MSGELTVLESLATADDVQRQCELMYGPDALSVLTSGGVIHVTSVYWDDNAREYRAIRINEHSPLCLHDFFVLNLVRAAAHYTIITGKLLRAEPSLQTKVQGPFAAALLAWRRRCCHSPLSSSLLSSPLSPKEPINDVANVIILTRGRHRRHEPLVGSSARGGGSVSKPSPAPPIAPCQWVVSDTMKDLGLDALGIDGRHPVFSQGSTRTFVFTLSPPPPSPPPPSSSSSHTPQCPPVSSSESTPQSDSNDASAALPVNAVSMLPLASSSSSCILVPSEAADQVRSLQSVLQFLQSSSSSSKNTSESSSTSPLSRNDAAPVPVVVSVEAGQITTHPLYAAMAESAASPSRSPFSDARPIPTVSESVSAPAPMVGCAVGVVGVDVLFLSRYHGELHPGARSRLPIQATDAFRFDDAFLDAHFEEKHRYSGVPDWTFSLYVRRRRT